jgi:glycogen operon protein
MAVEAPPLTEAAAPTGGVAGRAWPLGATIAPGGVNFSVYAKRASGLDLLLFDAATDDVPAQVITLEPATNRTAGYWHRFVGGLRPGQLYAWRARGPWDPRSGLRFDDRTILLDPYGRAVAVPPGYDRSGPVPATGGVPTGGVPTGGVPTGTGTAPGAVARAMKSVIVDAAAYDWHGDAPLRRPLGETVVYEAHLRGFTANPNSGVAPELRGTYPGFAERIPYLVDLGVTAVELLPVFQFDALDAPGGNPNYWGYQPIGFFAPHAGYASRPDPLAAVDEFRDLVRALHGAGIEVILDVVYNHTAENGPDGPTFCFRGLADDEYYLHDGQDRSRYADYTGTGNTLNANAAIVRRLILDSLRYWVTEMHVDGFRFDLAAVLSRDEDGRPLARPPVLWEIDTDPVLAGTKLIAEAWDAAGLYEVGSFAGDQWVEWNGRFRDDVRAFVKGDRGRVRAVAQRMLGSPDLYAALGREPGKSINFVTCHDGFTLEDLVSYDQKHNEANGEANHDGSNDNLSWNCGVEGPTDDPAIEALRGRQVRNLIALELLAVGVPMLTMGDEVRRTQRGNNNAYCQDGELSWFDWSLVDRHADTLSFTRRLIAARKRFGDLVGNLLRDRTLAEILEAARVEWHGVRLGAPDLGDDSHSIALTYHTDPVAIHLILNAYWEPLTFELPPLAPESSGWRRILDTSQADPDDLLPFDRAPSVVDRHLSGPRSVTVLGSLVGPTR